MKNDSLLDQIIAHQDGGQQFLGHIQQLTHAFTAVGILDVAKIIGTQREIGNLAARVECRQEESKNGDNDSNYTARRGRVECHKRMSARCAEYR